MSRRLFTGALSDEIAAAEDRSNDRDRVAQLHQAAKSMLELIREGLIQDGAVRLHHFGTFRLKSVAARKGINPQTGEPLVIAAHRRIVFTPAKALLDRIEPIHPAPIPLPAAEPAPKVVALGAARPVTPPSIITPPVPEPPIALSPTMEPSEPRHPERRWMAAAAIFAAIAVLVILTWPTQDQREPPTAVLTQQPSVPSTATGPENVSAPEAPTTPTSAIMQAENPPSAELQPGPTPVKPIPALSDLPSESTSVTEITPLAQAPERFVPDLGAASTETESEAVPAIASPATAIEPGSGIVQEAAAAPTADTPTSSAPFFSERTYVVSTGDSLWHLSGQHYQEPILWPHIYRANHAQVNNPDLIYIGDQLTLPELQGPPTALSAQDRERIAEGYYLVYQYYEAQRNPDAIYALIGTRWFDPDVYERHRRALSRQRLRIMEFAPRRDNSIARLLTAVFSK